MRISKVRLAQVGCVLVLIAFLIRHLRILWGNPLFDVFDLSRYGLPFEPSSYGFLNGFVVADTLLVLAWLSRRSPKVSTSRSESEHPSFSRDVPRSSGRERISDSKAFEGIEPKWKVVVPEKTEES